MKLQPDFVLPCDGQTAPLHDAAPPNSRQRGGTSTPARPTKSREAPSVTPRGYAAGAQAYVDAGWAGVLPVLPGEKKPKVSGFHGKAHRGQYPSEAKIRGWSRLTGNDTANLVLRPSETVIGIDVDAYDGKVGEATLAEAVRRWGALPTTWRSTSRPNDAVSGIFWFRVPADLWWTDLKRALNKADGLRANGLDAWADVETIWWGNRYGVVWPSTHPEGRPYLWFDPAGEVADRVPSPDELADLPQAWVAGLTREPDAEPSEREPARERASHSASAPPVPDPRTEFAPHQVEWVARGIEGRLGDIAKSGGARNEALNEHGLRVWRLWLTGASPFSESEVEQRLLDAMSATGYLRSDGVEAALNTIRSARDGAMRYGAAADLPEPQGSGGAKGDVHFEQSVSREVERLTVRDEARRRYLGEDRPAIPPFLTYTELLAQPLPPVKYRVNHLWPMGGNVLLVAQYKAGKTTLRDNVGRALVDGAPLFGQFRTEPVTRRVVVLDFELSPSMAQEWIADQGYQDTDRMTFVGMRGSAAAFDVTHPPTMHQWADRLREADCEVLVVDCIGPIMHALGLDENTEYGRLLTSLDGLAAEAGVSELVVIHHMGHSGERGKGDSRLRGWADAEWHLLRESDDDPASARFFRAYGRDVNFAETEVLHNDETRHLTLSDEGRTRKQKRGRPKDDAFDRDTEVVARILSEAALPLSIREVMAEFEKYPGTGAIERTKASKILNDLLRANRAEKVGVRGSAALWGSK